ncbi:hypothetical protein LUZ61_009455 [Rhynchospora tenuis]|uniref:Heat shock protein 70 n=1 Tax=Rhynchospora tenuis TaxID=198213 RepID=A0AAD5ZXA2_9POAL|nr:hypothetical protein LUZ61_009455 [Rhynchospora tenuis]
MLQDFFEGKELSKGIHPDEAVAYGAAIQAANLNIQGNKEVQNLVLVDVTPMSLGVGVGNGFERMLVVVPRNTPIPTKKEDVLTTIKDDQTDVTLKIYEGESCETKYNNLLGMFRLDGFDPAPQGVTKFDTCFNIDADGILNVSAKVRSTNLKNEIVISKQNGDLTAAEIQKMIEDAAHYKAEDEKQKARISLEDLAEKLKSMTMDPGRSASEINSMEKAAEKTIAWLETHPDAEIAEFNKRHGELRTTFPTLCQEN